MLCSAVSPLWVIPANRRRVRRRGRGPGTAGGGRGGPAATASRAIGRRAGPPCCATSSRLLTAPPAPSGQRRRAGYHTPCSELSKAIFAQGTRTHHYLELDVLDGHRASRAQGSHRLHADRVSPPAGELVIGIAPISLRGWRATRRTRRPGPLPGHRGHRRSGRRAEHAHDRFSGPRAPASDVWGTGLSPRRRLAPAFASPQSGRLRLPRQPRRDATGLVVAGLAPRNPIVGGGSAGSSPSFSPVRPGGRPAMCGSCRSGPRSRRLPRPPRTRAGKAIIGRTSPHLNRADGAKQARRRPPHRPAWS